MEQDLTQLVEKYGSGKDGFHSTGVQTSNPADIAIELSLLNDKVNELLAFKNKIEEIADQVMPFLEKIQENPMGFLMMMMGGK